MQIEDYFNFLAENDIRIPALHKFYLINVPTRVNLNDVN